MSQLFLTRAQVRTFDRLASEKLGIPSLILMENASRNAAEVILEHIEMEMHLIPGDAQVAVMCGSGNNAGDGFAVARHLANAGINVAALACSDPGKLSGDARTNFDIAQAMGLVEPWYEADHRSGAVIDQGHWHVVVDALLGTGFQGQVRSDLAQAIAAIHQLARQGAKVVALDVPSGLDCDTGEPGRAESNSASVDRPRDSDAGSGQALACVKADLTITFVAEKVGYARQEAAEFLGTVVPTDIGAPMWLLKHLDEG